MMAIKQVVFNMIRETSKEAKKHIDKRGITERQAANIFKEIKYMNSMGYKPTRKEIAVMLNIETSSVSARVNNMIKNGWVEEGEQVTHGNYRKAYELITTA